MPCGLYRYILCSSVCVAGMFLVGSPSLQPGTLLGFAVRLEWSYGDWRVLAPPAGDWGALATPVTTRPAGLRTYDQIGTS